MKLLIAAALLLLLIVGGVVLLLQMQRQQKAYAERVARVTGQRPARSDAVMALVRPDEKQKRTPASVAGQVIGYDLLRKDQYRLPWFAVCGFALLLGWIVVEVASSLVGTWAWLALPAIAIGGSRFYYGWSDGKRRSALLNQFPDSLSLIVRAVRVGIPVTESLRAVAREASEPTRTEFDRLAHQIAIGTTLEAALRMMASRNKVPEYSFFAAALSLQAQTGGGLTETLETLAEIIRKRLQMKARGHALSSEARTSAMVLGVLPIGTGGMLYLVSPDYISVLFTNPTGHVFLGIAVVSLAIGMGTMKLIISKSLS
jgi:tight adherence protein B